MNITFNSNGKIYTATSSDIFMDNGAQIVFIKDGRAANPASARPRIGNKEWFRILPQLTMVNYEEYYGRKPLFQGISIYKVKK